MLPRFQIGSLNCVACASTKRSDWTNIPPEPQHGSKTPPLKGCTPKNVLAVMGITESKVGK